MLEIFLSYRRADSESVVGRLYDRLVDAFGEKAVFKDVDSISPGQDFSQTLSDALGLSEVVLVVIGDEWLRLSGRDGGSRLEEESDYVRHEIEVALDQRKRILPVLVGTGRMPEVDELPKTISALAFKQGLQVRPDPDFSGDVARLISVIEGGSQALKRAATIRRSPPKSLGRRLALMAAIAGSTAAISLLTVALSTDTGVLDLARAFSRHLSWSNETTPPEGRPVSGGPGEGKVLPEEAEASSGGGSPSPVPSAQPGTTLAEQICIREEEHYEQEEPDPERELPDGLKLERTVSYPQICNHPSRAVELKMNARLREIAGVDKDRIEDEESVWYEISMREGNLLGLKFYSRFYAYGAIHGNTGSGAYHFNLRNGEEFTIPDMFRSGYREIIEAYLADHPPGCDESATAGYTDNFYLTRDSLVLLYDPYFLCAFAAGVVEIPVPLDILSRVVNPHGPMGDIQGIMPTGTSGS